MKVTVNAINKLKNNSAAGPDGVPAILLINTKDAITKPLQIILRKSINEGVIPNIFKLAEALRPGLPLKGFFFERIFQKS